MQNLVSESAAKRMSLLHGLIDSSKVKHVKNVLETKPNLQNQILNATFDIKMIAAISTF